MNNKNRKYFHKVSPSSTGTTIANRSIAVKNEDLKTATDKIDQELANILKTQFNLISDIFVLFTPSSTLIYVGESHKPPDVTVLMENVGKFYKHEKGVNKYEVREIKLSKNLYTVGSVKDRETLFLASRLMSGNRLFEETLKRHAEECSVKWELSLIEDGIEKEKQECGKEAIQENKQAKSDSDESAVNEINS